jgi:hypothetical protein
MSGESSRFAKTAKKSVRRGVSLYKVGASVGASLYWYAQIWNSSTSKYIVRSTKETSRIIVGEVAEELYPDLKQKKFLDDLPRAKTFIYFAEKLIQQRRLAGKTRGVACVTDDEKLLKRNHDGIINHFYKQDISSIQT